MCWVSGPALLRTNQPFRRLWAARTISYFGDSLSLVALMLYVAQSTGQALAVAVLLLVGDFAPALLGPLAGTVSDRFDLKRVMVGCELAQAALVAVTALWLPSLPMLLILVGCDRSSLRYSNRPPARRCPGSFAPTTCRGRTQRSDSAPTSVKPSDRWQRRLPFRC
jgi:hypothetical protein